MFFSPVPSSAPYGADDDEAVTTTVAARAQQPAPEISKPGPADSAPLPLTSLPPLMLTMSFMPPAAVGAAVDASNFSTDLPHCSDVGIHVYDLTRGHFAKELELLVGGPCDGVLHSAVVVFGNEYFFEGGVAVAAKGRTRFGNNFRYTYIGKTKLSQVEFDAWVRREEELRFQLAHYHPIEHNCHHFTLAACDVLCPKETTASAGSNTNSAASRSPTFLLDNVTALIGTDVGNLLHPLFRRLTGGVQFVISQHQAARDRAVIDFKDSLISHAASMSGLPADTFPGSLVAAFLPLRVEDVRAAIVALPSLVPPHAAFQPTSRESLEMRYLSASVIPGHSRDAQDEFQVSSFVTLCEVVFENTPLHQWEPVLRTARLGASHRSTLMQLLHSTKILSALMRITVEAHAAPRGVLVEAVQLVCNFCLDSHGASLLAEHRFCRRFISLAGYCMVQPSVPSESPALADLACALVNNMAVALTLASARVSLDHELGRPGPHQNHPGYQLLTVALYGLAMEHPMGGGGLQEFGAHFLLLAVVQLATSGRHCQLLFEGHPIKLVYDRLLARFKTDECRALLCLLSAIEDLAEP
jgi:hypothetical protein